MKKINNLTFFEFHTELLGLECFLNGKVIPKYIVFYRKYNLYEMFLNQSEIKLVEKKKRRNKK